jgi:hypothetical protein
MPVAEAPRKVAEVIKTLPQSQGKKRELEMVWLSRESGGKPQRVPESLFVAPE